jgi:hypothetical protein
MCKKNAADVKKNSSCILRQKAPLARKYQQ